MVTTISNMVKENLNALHATKKSFMEAESSEKNWSTLRYYKRIYMNEGFMTVDIVYYRKQNCMGWYGPAKISDILGD